MLKAEFLLSLPGGGEWIMIVVVLFALIACPVLAIVFYLQAYRLRKENRELLARLLDKNI